jgi:hypothetical protein
MASWIVVACLLQLRDEFNALAPARAKGADGTIGDTAHAAGGTSDHLPDEDYAALRGKDADHVDEVHALDITTDLNVPGLSLETVVQFILGRCRSGAEKRLRYIIFNRRIWEADTKTPWSQQVYTGTADPHTGHAHFSASYDSKLEASTASWHLEDIPVALTKDDRDWLAAKIDAAATAAAERVWATKLNVHVKPGEAPSLQPAGSILRYLSPEGAEGRELTVGVGDGIAALAEDMKKLLAAKPPADS